VAGQGIRQVLDVPDSDEPRQIVADLMDTDAFAGVARKP
jgi:hypothetical protein